jgi:hypothetical protein
MRRAWAAVVFSMVALGQNAAEPEIVRAAKSPYDLARYLETHKGFKWAPLWKALKTKSSTEVVSLLNPDQAIVVVRGPIGLFEFYLRYVQDAKRNWSFGGAYGAFVKNTEPLYQVTRLGGKPFLRVATQGPNFGPVPNNHEFWFDLTQQDFDPVFSFPTFADQEILPGTIMRQITGNALPSGPDSIDVVLTVEFSLSGTELGSVRFTGRYERHPGERRFSLRSAHLLADASAIPVKDFTDLADVAPRLTNERMLVYALPGLKALATGKDADARDELKAILEKCKDTPEKRTLLELLAKP